jgi:hypothetical protein
VRTAIDCQALAKKGVQNIHSLSELQYDQDGLVLAKYSYLSDGRKEGKKQQLPFL